MDSAQEKTVSRTMSRPLQVLGYALRQFKSQELAAESLQHVVQAFGERLKLLDLPEGMAGTDQGQPGVAEALAHHQLLLKEYRLGYGDLVAALSPPDEAGLEKGFRRMAAADAMLGLLLDEMRQRNEAYQQAAEARNTVTCPRCGTRNRRGQSSCQQCRFMLPVTLNEREESDVMGGGEGDPTAAVQALRTLTGQWLEDDNPHPLYNKLKEMLAGYERGVQKSQSLLAADQLTDDVRNVVRQTVDAMQGLVEATEQAVALVEQGNNGPLEGVYSAMEAALQDVETLRLQYVELAAHYQAQLRGE